MMMTAYRWILFIGLVGVVYSLSDNNRFDLACGVRPPQRQSRFSESELTSTTKTVMMSQGDQNQQSQNLTTRGRKAKIIAGDATRDGNFPWQVSLELLHPSLGFLGHWCGGVLIDRNWIISAAHCVHNDLFNLPLPALWTAVLGDHNRKIESGHEQRITIEKIVMHQKYHNFQHDLVLMKLSRPAHIFPSSQIRKICLPFISASSHYEIESIDHHNEDLNNYLNLNKEENYLRSIKFLHNFTTSPTIKDIVSNSFMKYVKDGQNTMTFDRNSKKMSNRRRNDKFFQEKNTHNRRNDNGYAYLMQSPDIIKQSSHNMKENKEIPYTDCIATGWGKSEVNGDLTDILLKAEVPIHNNARCDVTYGGFVKMHKGHLCAGRLDGKGGTCVGDSGGPLQCRLSQNSPWILVGITSFGSGCALPGYPDVYTRISFYMKWITKTISRDEIETKDLRY